jgi:hypothetical protein
MKKLIVMLVLGSMGLTECRRQHPGSTHQRKVTTLAECTALKGRKFTRDPNESRAATNPKGDCEYDEP